MPRQKYHRDRDGTSGEAFIHFLSNVRRLKWRRNTISAVICRSCSTPSEKTSVRTMPWSIVSSVTFSRSVHLKIFSLCSKREFVLSSAEIILSLACRIDDKNVVSFYCGDELLHPHGGCVHKQECGSSNNYRPKITLLQIGH